ncbi:class I SAM-dependent methyltransferase [Tabrizicola sp. YIM 78059]|uniref:class I SAM-dependent methyltransferase n=1 Tax=Tabrizicola sp. YIM 78059 TaxID=2529861 RepID=UPI0010AA3F4C|nr:class I SAM-dependent methyltransferase [Tabrizicola sp. YIM 78059]
MSEVTKLSPEVSQVARIATDVFAPASFDFLFLRPRHLVDSPAVIHLPLLFWTCAALRPRDAAVVGVGDGIVQFALCQAIERLGAQGRCTGYGFWGNPHPEMDGRDIPEPLLHHQQVFYEDVSRLLSAGNLDRVAAGMLPGSLDLLWLDLTAAPDGLAQRAELLQRALRPGGVMFLHGVNLVASDSPDGLALRRLKAERRGVSFDGDQGLLLLPAGEGIAPRIAALIAAADGAQLPPEVERVFRRIGHGLLASVRLADAAAARTDAEMRASEARKALETAENAVQSLSSSYELRHRTLAEVQSALFDARMMVADLKERITSIEAARTRECLDHEATVGELRRQMDNLRANLDQSEIARASLSASHAAAEEKARDRIEALCAEAESLRERLAETEREREAHLSETAALARISEDLRSQLAQAAARNEELSGRLETAQRLIQDTEAKLKREISEERQLRFRETATLTRMLEKMKAQAARKPRPLEEWLVKRFVGDERKLRKYWRDRVAFFSDSRSLLARAYLRLRPGH